MSDSLWAEAKAIVAELLDHPASAQPALIAQRATRPDLRAEVESLLAAHARAGAFIAEPFEAWLDDGTDDESPALRAGTLIGAYRLLKELGHGGMGTVYLAERADRAFDKQVAIKIVAGHVAPPALTRRFLDERRILATLDHPNIAHLLDAGATADGVPYVVMEYVDGTTIDRHCQERRLPLRGRLALFRQVCDAVHHAHQRLIVHRDIKPANILVTNDGTPKLLDFGIAKLLEDGQGSSDTGLRAFTPESASPEQVRNEPVTVTSDVYSLGVLLYRLLTDRRVFDFDTASQHEIVRRICDQEPAAPSRAAAPGERIPRDLDWITLKALRKEPARRYASVAQLSDDCGRYLSGQPVLAAPDSVPYRTGKFLRRHWVGVSAAAAIIVTIAGTGAAVWYQRQRAERRFNEVRQLANTVVGELYDAIAEVPGSTKARQLLVSRALGYLDRLATEAGNDISLKRDLADAYQKVGDVQGNPYGPNLGDIAGARQSYEKLRDLRRSIADATHDRASAIALGRAHARLGDLDLAEAHYDTSVRAYQEALSLFGSGDQAGAGETLEDRGRTLGRIGVALMWSGRRDEAATVLQDAIQLTQSLADRPGASRPIRRALAVHHANLGDVRHFQRDYESALVSHRHAAELARAILQEAPSETSPRRDVIMTLARVGADLIELKRHDEAIRATEESIAVELELIAADPSNVQFQFDLADLYGNLAASQREMKQLDAALESIQRSIDTSERAAARNPSYAANRSNFAGALSQMGQVHRERGAHGEAARAFRRSLEVLDSVPGDQRDPTLGLYTRGELAVALAAEAARTHSEAGARESEAMLRQALDQWLAYEKDHPVTADERRSIERITAALRPTSTR